MFQPIVDLRDGAVVGYEALLRGGAVDGKVHGAEALLAAARREDTVLALDLASRGAALQEAEARGLKAPFALFLNADQETLDGGSAELPATGFTLLMEVTEAAVIARPEAMLARAHAAALGRLGHRARRRRRRLALARADVDPLSGRDQARPAAARGALAGGRRARRHRRGRRGGAAPRDRAGGGDRLRGPARGRARNGRDPRPGLPARRAGAAPRRAAAPGPPAAAAGRRRRPVRADPVGARDELAPPERRAAPARGARGAACSSTAPRRSARRRWC